jgi:putative CocE/NonD family hydrolase
MAMFPSERWFGGTIPILFHIILASFMITIGLYHKRTGALQETKSRKWTKVSWNVSYVLIGVLIMAWISYQLLPTLFAYKTGMRHSVYSVSIDKQVSLQAVDGALLKADIYRPEKLNPAPTILVRIPLDNNFKGKFMSNVLGRLWAERGYNVVIQGVRGRYFSEGKHIPFQTERSDGLATLEWLNKQSWHNGKCGMWGGSYFGYTQWALFDQDKLGLKALLTQISSSSNYKMFYPGGAFSYQSALFWATRSHSDVDTQLDYEQLIAACKKAPPVKADDRVVGDIHFYNAWVTHTNFDSYWQQADGRNRASQLKMPILMMAGWYDPYLNSQVQDFEDLSNHGDKNIANESRLIIGPWAHAETVKMPDGYIDENYRLASIAPSIDWYDRQLSGRQVTKTPRVKLFVMGINKWRYEDSFPLKRTKYTSYFLSGITNDGRTGLLDTSVSLKNDASIYSYNPANPIPSIGGSFLGANAGPKPQNEIEKRKDMLTYSSQILQNDLEVTGKIKLILYVSTSTKNTDFIAKLIDVHPGGMAYNISEGIIRKDYSGKDKIEQIEIELNPTSNVFLKGHKIHLEVMSSNYPRYSLNYNTGGNNYNEIKGIVAEQKIYSGKVHSSRLILPVIPAN